MQNVAIDILKRAVEADKNCKLTESMLLYQEGIQILINVLKQEKGERATHIRNKIEEYMNRAELIKKKLNDLKAAGNYHEQIEIKDNAKGYSYTKLFSRFLEDDVRHCVIEDPYIRTFHQCQNLIRFIEVLIKHCNIEQVKLITIKSNEEQANWFHQIREDVSQYNITFIIEYQESLHDRRILLSNGWIIKIGRGLDYFKPPTFKLAVGATDMDFRRCHQTTIDIFHSNNVKQVT